MEPRPRAHQFCHQMPSLSTAHPCLSLPSKQYHAEEKASAWGMLANLHERTRIQKWVLIMMLARTFLFLSASFRLLIDRERF